VAVSLLIDTNLSVLLVVGLVDEAYIAKYKRLRPYDVEDFRWIKDQASAADELVTVPNVLTETSNLLRYVDDPIKSEVMSFFGGMLRNLTERYVPSKEAADRQEFVRLGLTDAVLLRLGETGASLLTADLDLFLAAQAAGFEAVNYNHVRQLRPDFNI
jgi:hypothetical protein